MEQKVMNKEFKKIVSKTETRYVLEAASAGATSSGAVATGPAGKKGNLLVQGKDEKPVVQRRNPVAANVNATVGGGGAGAHKDRKRAEKRGEVKHKKDWRKDVDESDVPPKAAFNPKPQRIGPGGSKDDYRYTRFVPRGKDAKEKWAIKQSVDDRNQKLRKEKPKAAPSTDFYKNYLSNRPAREDVAEGWGGGAYSTVAGSEPIAKHVPQENVSPGYIDQENDMTSSSLGSLYKQDVKLRDLIKKMGDDTTLEPWQQEKIAKASDYVNSVFRSLDDKYGLDSLEEEKQKGVDGKACWKGYKRMGTKKKGGKTVDNCVKVGEDLNEEKNKGLWANIRDRKKKGLPPRKPGEKGAPTKKSWDAAVSASKKKRGVGEDNLQEYERYRYTDDDGNEWEIDDEGNKTLLNPARSSSSYRSRYTTRSYPVRKQPEVYYFYNVPDGSAMKAYELGLKRTKSGKWYSSSPSAAAEKEFGKGREWRPKTNEAMLPADHFAGTPKHKLGPKAHLKGKMKRPARQGDLVGGAEESYSKKKTLKKN